MFSTFFLTQSMTGTEAHWFDPPYASAAGASEENLSDVCDISLENAMNKNLPSECFGPHFTLANIARSYFLDVRLPVSFSKNVKFV